MSAGPPQGTPTPRARALAASLVAGGLLGCADALAVLISSPDPGKVSYRLGYALGPVLLGVACALPFGLGAMVVGARRGGRRAPIAALAGPSALWAASVLVHAWRDGEGMPALAVRAVGVALAAVAVVRLALDATTALERLPARQRRIAWGAAVAVLAGAFAATAPSGAVAFRGGTGPCRSAGSPVPQRPNVLLVSVDALRLDAARTMASYGRLAAAGVEFTQHVTNSAWTLPSLASLLSGLPGDRHGAGLSESSRSVIAKSPLRPGIDTVAGRLGVQGYRTHAIVTNPFLTSRYGVDRGFCTFTNVTMEVETARGLEQTTLGRLAWALAPRALPSDRAPVIRTRAERWLTTHDDGPFFLWLHFLDPHAPYGDRDGAPTSLTTELMAFQAGRGLEAPFRSIGLVRAGEYRPPPDERRRIFDLYREDVAVVDREIARLLDFLIARGLAEQTAIVLTADHGEEFWEHGGIAHGHALYDEVLRIPLVVVAPGDLTRTRPGGERRSVTELTTVLDVAPTVLALAGVSADGLPGLDLLAGPPPSSRPLVLGNLLFGEEWAGVRDARFKYLRSEDGEERLFDLASDPTERLNRAADMPEALAAARRSLGALGTGGGDDEVRAAQRRRP